MDDLFIISVIFLSGWAGWLLSWVWRGCRRQHKAWKKNRNPVFVENGDIGFLLKDPIYVWVKDPQDQTMFYLADKENKIIYPTVQKKKKAAGDKDPKVEAKDKQVVALLSPLSVSTVEWSKYLLFRSQKKYQHSTFFNYINKKRK